MRFSGPVLHFGISADNFAQLLQRSYRPLGNTLLLATLAACGATLIGVPIGYIVARHRSRLSALIEWWRPRLSRSPAPCSASAWSWPTATAV